MVQRVALVIAVAVTLASPELALANQTRRPTLGRYDAARDRRATRYFGWGVVWGGVTAFSAAAQLPWVASAGAGATAYSFTKSRLLAGGHPHAHQVAKNVGFGTFFTGVGLIGALVGGPFTLALGVGGLVFNFWKASFLYRSAARAR